MKWLYYERNNVGRKGRKEKEGGSKGRQEGRKEREEGRKEG